MKLNRHKMWALPWLAMKGEKLDLNKDGAWMILSTEDMAKRHMIEGHTKPIPVIITIRKSR